MLGLSLSKLVFLAAVIAAVWYGFKLYRRLEAAGRARAAAHRGRPSGLSRPAPDAEDLVRCGTCGTYVAAGHAFGCARPDCPHRG